MHGIDAAGEGAILREACARGIERAGHGEDAEIEEAARVIGVITRRAGDIGAAEESAAAIVVVEEIVIDVEGAAAL